MEIRQATTADFDAIWPVFHDIVAAGDTYAYDPAISKEEACRQWIDIPRKTFIAEEDGTVLGTYYLKTNHDGPGNHVCNCGYMVAAEARGKGIATLMCEHSQATALALGYAAMQFNFVASTNTGALYLWQKLGFEIVGTLPRAFKHPQRGYVDALVMYKWLQDA